MHVKQAWLACPKGCLPILLGDLNVNLAALCRKRNDTITKQVNAMALMKILGMMDMADEEGEMVGLVSL